MFETVYSIKMLTFRLCLFVSHNGRIYSNIPTKQWISGARMDSFFNPILLFITSNWFFWFHDTNRDSQPFIYEIA